MPLSHLNRDSAAASRSRVDLCREGLEGPAVDRPLWIRAAAGRIEELEARERVFGLEDFEREELAELSNLIGRGRLEIRD